MNDQNIVTNPDKGWVLRINGCEICIKPLGQLRFMDKETFSDEMERVCYKCPWKNDFYGEVALGYRDRNGVYRQVGSDISNHYLVIAPQLPLIRTRN